ncbi:MAG: alanine racemase, partial [Candidatus Dormibacterales bacterium]
IAVVKANGYGHGDREAARAAREGGAGRLAVATLAEARRLQGLCPRRRVVVLGGLFPGSAREAVETGAAVVCSSSEMAHALAREAEGGWSLPVHLKVDTGMGRFGCAPHEAPEIAALIARSTGLELAGTMTHFASAGTDESFTRAQFGLFTEVCRDLGLPPGTRHACNSAAARRFPEMALDAVRCGIALYGCEWPGLKPALSLRARVLLVKRLPAGASVGYGRTWRAGSPATVALIGAGYADGVHRARSNLGWAFVKGRRAAVVGAVSMDTLALDVTDVPEVRAGDVATLIGEDSGHLVSAEEVADWSGTISYEVLTSLGARVARVYRGQGAAE